MKHLILLLFCMFIQLPEKAEAGELEELFEGCVLSLFRKESGFFE